MQVQVAPGKWRNFGPVNLTDSLWPCHAKRKPGECRAIPNHRAIRILDGSYYRRIGLGQG